MPMMPWPVAADLLPPTTTPDNVTRMQTAIDTATYILFVKTGAQYGLNRVIARPCPFVQDTTNDYTGHHRHITPVLYGGQWHNVACGGGCQSDGPGSIRLPGPVHLVEAVTVDGITIDPDGYSVEGDRIRRAGGRAWPDQNLQRPLGEPGTWSVLYLQGIAPPAGADAMVATLAGELYNAATGGKCRLPNQWQTVQRQGVTVTRMQPSELIELGLTGLPEVDMWVSSLNPNRITRPARVASVDTLGGR